MTQKIEFIAVSASGISVLNIATGLHPALLIAGFIGGLWAQTYAPSKSFFGRIGMSLIASLVSGWFTPAVVAVMTAHFNFLQGVSPRLLELPTAVIFGLLVHTVIGPFAIKFVKRKLNERIK